MPNGKLLSYPITICLSWRIQHWRAVGLLFFKIKSRFIVLGCSLANMMAAVRMAPKLFELWKLIKSQCNPILHWNRQASMRLLYLVQDWGYCFTTARQEETFPLPQVMPNGSIQSCATNFTGNVLGSSTCARSKLSLLFPALLRNTLCLPSPSPKQFLPPSLSSPCSSLAEID